LYKKEFRLFLQTGKKQSLKKRESSFPPQEEIEYLRKKLILWKQRYTELKTWVESQLDQPIPSDLHNNNNNNTNNNKDIIPTEEDYYSSSPLPDGQSQHYKKLKPIRELPDSILPPIVNFAPFIPPAAVIQPHVMMPPLPFYWNPNGIDWKAIDICPPASAGSYIDQQQQQHHFQLQIQQQLVPGISQSELKEEKMNFGEPISKETELSAFRGIGLKKDSFEEKKVELMNQSDIFYHFPKPEPLYSKMVPVLLVQKSTH